MLIAIDQYGGNKVEIKKYPRNELLDHFGAKHADKVYVDTKEKESIHIGYIVAGYWFTIYELTPLKKENGKWVRR